jgi:hypothetical protein
LAKPPSKIAFEPLDLAEAMHSEMGRPESLGGLIVATGPWSRSTIPSPPFSTLASTARIAGEIGVASVEGFDVHDDTSRTILLVVLFHRLVPSGLAHVVGIN